MISDKQRAFYWRLWSAACKAQGWTSAKGWKSAQIDAKRHEVQSQALGCEVSMKSLSNAQFDRVKAAFQALADSLQGVHETAHAEDGDRRRWIWVVEHEVKPCLRLYVEDVESYLAEVLRDRFKIFAGLSHWTELDHAPIVSLGASGEPVEYDAPLKQFLMTVTRMMHARRKKAGDTIHAMLTKAGLECPCKECCQVRAYLAATATEEPENVEAVQAANEPF